MRNTYLNELVKKISKKQGKLMYSNDIKKIVETLMKEQYTDTKAYKLIYYLKNRGHVISIKKEIFYIKHPDTTISEDEIVDTRYRQILHDHCTQSFNKARYIGAGKALELHENNFSIPDTIHVVNQKKQSKEMIVATKAVQFKKYTAKNENYWHTFKKHTNKIKMGKYSFTFANKELALLESMYNHNEYEDIQTHSLVKKVLKRSTQINTDTIIQIIKLGKHHTSINRLYKIAKETNKSFAEKLNDIIKRYSFFLDV